MQLLAARLKGEQVQVGSEGPFIVILILPTSNPNPKVVFFSKFNYLLKLNEIFIPRLNFRNWFEI